MSNHSNDISSFSTQSCECYKKLQTYGIPLYIDSENDFYGECQKKISFENAFQLPGKLVINESITEYLNVEDTELCNVFTQMTDLIPNLSDFEQNPLSFWILDMLIEGLWTAQSAKMNFDHQKATLQWIVYMFNYIQEENPTRKHLFDHLKAVLLRTDCKKKVAEDSVEKTGESSQKIPGVKKVEDTHNSKETEIWKLPIPPNIEEKRRKEYDETKIPTTEEENGDENSTENESLEGKKASNSVISQRNEVANITKTNLTSMRIILDILYRIFGRFWVFLEIATVFHSMPPTKQVNLPFILKVPKPVLKQDVPTSFKPDKIGRRLSFPEKSFEELDSETQLHKNDFILPLQMANESEVILKQYFHQPSSQRSLLGKKKT